MNLTDLPPACKAANPQLFPAAPSVGATTNKPVVPEMTEAALQDACEEYMRYKGFLLMSPANFDAVACGQKVCRGFYGHLHECRTNVEMPDIFAFPWPAHKRPFLCELKTHDRWQPGQKAAIGIRLWQLAMSVREFQLLFDLWEKEK